MSLLFYLLYAVVYLFLLAYGALLFRSRRRLGTLLLLLVTFGVFYDNLLLSLGNFLGDGPLLYTLSVPRFVLHQVVLPWIIYAGYEQARQAGHGWAQQPALRWGMAVLSALVMAAGIATRLWGLHLEPTIMDGVVRYVAVGVSGPPIVSIVSIGLFAFIGAPFWRWNGWPWIVLATIAVFIGETLPDEGLRRAIGSALEVIFLAVLFVTQQRLDTNQLAAMPHQVADHYHQP
ncbi:MAG: hypothetical protein R2873_31350 [Caldilineaceae bacterium]|nr:hypothetical protein [Caldilineaceae bacterium]